MLAFLEMPLRVLLQEQQILQRRCHRLNLPAPILRSGDVYKSMDLNESNPLAGRSAMESEYETGFLRDFSFAYDRTRLDPFGTWSLNGNKVRETSMDPAAEALQTIP